jgi:hypothetical protein
MPTTIPYTLRHHLLFGIARLVSSSNVVKMMEKVCLIFGVFDLY